MKSKRQMRITGLRDRKTDYDSAAKFSKFYFSVGRGTLIA